MSIGPADIPRSLPVPVEAPVEQEPSAGDLDRLLGECVERAGRALEADGAFWPFALCLTTDGQLAEPRISPETEDPQPQDVLLLLRGALRSGRDQLRATAVCSDVTVQLGAEDGEPEPEPTRALQVELEARGGDPLVLVVPFAREEGGRPVFRQPLGQRGTHAVWG